MVVTPSFDRRVVVTGMSAISPIGLNLEETWNNLLLGKSGAATIASFDVSDYPVRFACEVKGFEASPHISPKEHKKMDRFLQFGIVAGLEAWRDAGFSGRAEANHLDPHRVGVCFCTGMGGLPSIERNYSVILEKGPKRVSPFFIPSTIPNMIGGYLSIELNLRGYNFAIVSACASASHGIGEGAWKISQGIVDQMIVGGSEAVISPSGLAGFSNMKALSQRNEEPEKSSRPFDRDRDGFVMGEGSAALVLEEYEHAKKRGARIYGELVSYFANSDAHHVTAPCMDGRGAEDCMRSALKIAKIDPNKVDYINAHGTSTPVGDIAESLAIENVFGDHAKNLIVSSTKSMTGHLLGAAGAIESCVALKAIQTGHIPPTINLENQDEKCRLNYAPNEAVQKKCQYVMNNSFGFGGTNAAILFSAQ